MLHRESETQGRARNHAHCVLDFVRLARSFSPPVNDFFARHCTESFGFGLIDLGCIWILPSHPLGRFRKCELFLSLIFAVLISEAACWAGV